MHPHSPASAAASPKLSCRRDERKNQTPSSCGRYQGVKGGEKNDSGMGRFCRKARADHERRPKDWLFKNL